MAALIAKSARGFNGLGIMRAVETATLERIGGGLIKWRDTTELCREQQDRPLSARIEVLAGRRWGTLRLEMLTDEAWAKIEALTGGEPVDVRKRTGCEHLSDDVILRALIRLETLNHRDFEPLRGRS